jgi:hypothetical protein
MSLAVGKRMEIVALGLIDRIRIPAVFFFW